MLTQAPTTSQPRLPRTGGWDDAVADGALPIDAIAGNALLVSLDRKWESEGRQAFVLKRSFDTLWNHAQRRGFRQAAAEVR
jgi:hypothetical protein